MISRKKEVSCSLLTRKEKTMLMMLLRNGREFNTQIAMKLNITSQVTGRIRKCLEKDGVIKGYSIELDHKYLGVRTFVLALFNLKGSCEEKLMSKNLINFYKVIANSITHIGLYAFKNLKESDKFFNSLVGCSDNLKIINTYVFPVEGLIKQSSKNLFYNALRSFDNGGSFRALRFSNNNSKKEFLEITSVERDILKSLVKKSNLSPKKISSNNSLKISRSKVNRTKNKLEKRGIIRSYDVELDYEKLDINVLTFIFVKPKPEIIKKQAVYIQQCHNSKNVISCYRLNEETAMLCGFRNLNDLENYFNMLRSQYQDLIEIKDVHIVSPKGVIKESFDDLYLSLLNNNKSI